MLRKALFSVLLLFLSSSISFADVATTSGYQPYWGSVTATPLSNTTTNNQEDISKPEFVIDVGDISPGWSRFSWEWTAKQTADFTIKKIITMLMTAFWALALFVMTIWWGYMVLYSWQDDLLSKWKSIFTAWLIALVVALSSLILVKLVSYFLQA